MKIKKTNEIGSVNVSMDAIVDLAGLTASSVYGVVGLVDKKSFANPLKNLLKTEDFADGVSVHKNKEGYEVNLYLVVSKDIKIIEVVYEIQKQVSYKLKKTFGISTLVNVFIQAIR